MACPMIQFQVLKWDIFVYRKETAGRDHPSISSTTLWLGSFQATLSDSSMFNLLAGCCFPAWEWITTPVWCFFFIGYFCRNINRTL